jgi:hypothetical protein
MLVSGKCNFNLSDQDGAPTALHFAIAKKKGTELAAILRLLTTFQPDLNLILADGNHALRMAVEKHIKQDAVLSLLTTADLPPVQADVVNARMPKNNLTLLAHCMQQGSYDSARGLLMLGANPTILPEGAEPLLITAIKIRRMDLILTLMSVAKNFAEQGDIRAMPGPDGLHPALVAALDLDALFVRTVIESFIYFKVPLAHVCVPDMERSIPGEEHMLPGSSLLLELIKRGFCDAALALKDYYQVSRTGGGKRRGNGQQDAVQLNTCSAATGQASGIPFVKGENGKRRDDALNLNERDARGRSLIFLAACRFITSVPPVACCMPPPPPRFQKSGPRVAH